MNSINLNTGTNNKSFHHSISQKEIKEKSAIPPEEMLKNAQSSKHSTISREKIPKNDKSCSTIVPSIERSEKGTGNIRLRNKSRKTLTKEQKESIHDKLQKIGISEKACQVIIKNIQPVARGGFSLSENLVYALHQEISSLVQYHKTVIRIESVQQNLIQFQRFCSEVSLFFLLAETTTLLKEMKLFSPLEEHNLEIFKESSLSNSELSNSKFISNVLKMNSIWKDILNNEKVEKEFLLRFRGLKNKSKGYESLKTVKQKIVEYGNTIEELILTMDELLKLPDPLFIQCIHGDVQSTFELDLLPHESPTINKEIKKYYQSLLPLLEIRKSKDIESFNKDFENLYNNIDAILNEEELFNLYNFLENHKNEKQVELLAIYSLYIANLPMALSSKNQLNLGNLDIVKGYEEYLSDLLKLYTYNTTYYYHSINLFRVICNCYSKKNPYILSAKAQIQLNILWKKLDLLKEENGLQLPYLINEFKEKLKNHFTLETSDGEKIQQCLQAMIHLSDKKTKELSTAVKKLITEEITFFHWKLAKIACKDLKEEIVIFNKNLEEGCRGIESILSSSSISLNDFQILKGEIHVFKKNISEILKPLIDLPFVVDNLIYPQQLNVPYEEYFEMDLEDELELFHIDFETVESCINFVEIIKNEEIEKGPILSSEKEELSEYFIKPIVSEEIEALISEPNPSIQESTVKKNVEPLKKRNLEKKSHNNDALGSVKTKKVIEYLIEKGFKPEIKPSKRAKSSHVKFKIERARSSLFPLIRKRLLGEPFPAFDAKWEIMRTFNLTFKSFLLRVLQESV